MRPFFKLARILFALCVCATVPVQAQTNDRVRTAILTFAPVGLPQDFTALFETEGSFHSFNPSSKNLSRPVIYAGPRRLVLRSSEEEFAQAEAESANVPPLASVELPGNADMCLVIAVPGEGRTVRLQAYDISSDQLKPGGYRIFNFTKKNLAIAMNDQRLAIDSGGNTLVSDQKWTKEPLALRLMIASNTSDGYELVYSSYYGHYPQRRSLIFLFDGNNPSRPIVFSSFNAGTSPIKPVED